MRTIKRLLNDVGRAKLIFNSIKEPMFDIIELKNTQEIIIVFGSKKGSVIYIYSTTKPYEIKEIINESN